MKRTLLLLTISLLSFNLYSQIQFEKGYFIDNNGNKTECLIKNYDWRNNPLEIEYKISEKDQPIIANIKDIAEFGVANNLKYIRFFGKIDKSTESLDLMSTEKNPVFNEKELFLKVLVDGKASLYMYEEAKFVKFFFKSEDTDIEQLIFKSYKVTDDKVAVNNQFKQQLLFALNCKGISMQNLETLQYKRNELVSIFVKYNDCLNSIVRNYELKQKRDLFNLTIRPGYKKSSLSVDHIYLDQKDVNFDNQFDARFGIEVEFIFPFNKNKWSIILEPTYQSFKSANDAKLIPHAAIADFAEIDYTSIEIPIGIRHYLFLNKNSKFFVNGSIVLDISNDSKIYYKNSADQEIDSKVSMAYGFGYNYLNRYSVELRNTSRNILSIRNYSNPNYKSLSIILGYTLF